MAQLADTEQTLKFSIPKPYKCTLRAAQAKREARETTAQLADTKQQLADAKLDLDTCLNQCAPLVPLPWL